MNHLTAWGRLMGLGNRLGCHQMPERSFFYHGYQFPLCARCTGLVLGQFTGLPAYLLGLRPPIWLSMTAIGLMAMDGGTQYLGWQTSTNPRRLVTGFMAGYGYISLFLDFIRWILG